MKSKIVLGALVLFIAGGTLTTSCKKRDKIQPVITLNGEKEQAISLNTAYVESGAVAMDNKGGDISSDIVITGSVDVNRTGEYRMYYDVQDENGNKAATAIRFVNVYNSADYMVGTYLATPSCSGTSTTNDYNTTVTASQENNNRIYIKRVLWTVEDDPILAEVNGTSILIPLQTVGDQTVEGSGTISGSEFVLSVMIDGWYDYSCTINHSKL